jgi:hypothetical protein
MKYLTQDELRDYVISLSRAIKRTKKRRLKEKADKESREIIKRIDDRRKSLEGSKN